MNKFIILVMCVLALGCHKEVDWPKEGPNPDTRPQYDAAPASVNMDSVLLDRLNAQAGKPRVERFSDVDGVIDGYGLAVPKESLNETSECIHDMPLNWTCTLCPPKQRVWKESCPVQ